jgi:2-polyprenyl-3-methyl-5-hydroxy-6-metoxy-1,4-benzoquinol methylase
MEIDERVKIILNLCENRDVLDVGCVDHMAVMSQDENWLHKKIMNVAHHCLGIDIAINEIEKIDPKFNIMFGDAHTINLQQSFDVIVAGELIEHLENPGIFLRNMSKHLKYNGCIVLTTPNPFYPKRLLDIIFKGKTYVLNEHTCWYCDITISQLLERCGFERVNIYYTNASRRFKHIARFPSRIRNRLSSHIVAVAYRNTNNAEV